MFANIKPTDSYSFLITSHIAGRILIPVKFPLISEWFFFLATGALHQDKKFSSVRITFTFFTVDISRQTYNLIRIISYAVARSVQNHTGHSHRVWLLFRQLLQRVTNRGF